MSFNKLFLISSQQWNTVRPIHNYLDSVLIVRIRRRVSGFDFSQQLPDIFHPIFYDTFYKAWLHFESAWLGLIYFGICGSIVVILFQGSIFDACGSYHKFHFTHQPTHTCISALCASLFPFSGLRAFPSNVICSIMKCSFTNIQKWYLPSFNKRC